MLLVMGSSADTQCVCCVFSGQDGLALASHQIHACEERLLSNSGMLDLNKMHLFAKKKKKSLQCYF